MSPDRSRHPFQLERLIEYSRALVSASPEATVLVVDHAQGYHLGRPTEIGVPLAFGRGSGGLGAAALGAVG